VELWAIVHSAFAIGMQNVQHDGEGQQATAADHYNDVRRTLTTRPALGEGGATLMRWAREVN